MEAAKYLDKNIRVFCKSGAVISGVMDEHTTELDNEPYGSCIAIGNVEILEKNIIKIELIDE